MRRSSLVALSSLLMVASVSPSFAHATGTEARLGPQRTTTRSGWHLRCPAPIGPLLHVRAENLQLSWRTQNGHLVVRIIFPASQGQGYAQHGAGCLTVPGEAIDRCDPDQKTRVLFENMRQHRAGHQTNAMGSSHSGLNDREPDSISALSRNHSCRNHLILNGMMMSPPNVNANASFRRRMASFRSTKYRNELGPDNQAVEFFGYGGLIASPTGSAP
ncbi:hypothetical protein J2S34_003837 [Nitrobacter winogradskyi]|uniref:Uncharacterized protein n=1 Tax=Nitrobacter winogradskyi TaxID=913 RepID=A0ACC6ANY4_NITWI|nr:hypothetical protein [Nitrobacter winogradskyi]